MFQNWREGRGGGFRWKFCTLLSGEHGQLGVFGPLSLSLGGGAKSSPQPGGNQGWKSPTLKAASGTMQESGAPPGSRAREVCALRTPRAPAVRAHARRLGSAWQEAATTRPGRPSPSPRTCSTGARSMAPAAATGLFSRCGGRLGPLSPWPPARV